MFSFSYYCLFLLLSFPAIFLCYYFPFLAIVFSYCCSFPAIIFILHPDLSPKSKSIPNTTFKPLCKLSTLLIILCNFYKSCFLFPDYHSLLKIPQHFLKIKISINNLQIHLKFRADPTYYISNTLISIRPQNSTSVPAYALLVCNICLPLVCLPLVCNTRFCYAPALLPP